MIEVILKIIIFRFLVCMIVRVIRHVKLINI